MYIVKISPTAFIKKEDNAEIIIVSDYLQAKVFEKIGDAMKAAASVNELININKAHVFSL